MTEKNKILNFYTINKFSIREIAKEVNRSTSYVTKILIESGHYVYSSGEQATSKKLSVNPNKQYVAKCKKTQIVIKDYLNKSGLLIKHISETYPDIIIPSKFLRKSFEKKNGFFWYENFFEIIEIDTNFQETKKCPYCDWVTLDIENKSGAFTAHLSNIHNIHIIKYLEEFPADKILFKTHLEKEEYKTNLTGHTDNFVVCKICNVQMRKIGNTHLKKHNISTSDYKKKYGNTTSVSTSKLLSDITIQNNKKLYTFGNNHKTNIENDFFNLLTRLQIKFEVNKYVKPYFYDIFIPDNNLFIELDGIYWHGHDRIENWGFNIFRNVIKDYKKSKLVNNIVRLIENKSLKIENLNQIQSKDSFFNFCLKENFKIENHTIFNLKEHQNVFSKQSCSDLTLEHKNTNKLLEDFEFLMRNFYSPDKYKNFIDIENRQTIEFKLKGAFFESFYNAHKQGEKNLKEIFNNTSILPKVIKYRFGINKSKELFDINIKNIYRGIEVMTMFNVGIFPAKRAEKIYDNYINYEQVVFDPFAGWGTRLIGLKKFINFKKCSYIGFDINNLLIPGYDWIYKNIFPDNQTKFIQIYDSLILNKSLINKIDFILTSPPYFNDEIYSKSHITFENLEKWKDEFLTPIFQNCFKYLKNDCNMLIDMKETYSDAVILSAQNAGFKYVEMSKYNVNKSHYAKNKKQQFILVFKK